MKIAIFQADTIENQIDSNLKRYDSFLDNLDKDTELLVFPEMFTTGFNMNTLHAETMQEKGLNWMKEKAIEKQIAIAGTLLIKEDNKYINRHFFVFPNGEMEYYDKKHLFCLSKEPKVVSKGSEKKIVEYKGWKIALFTCYDIRFPVWCRNSQENDEYDYDIAIYSASWDSARNIAWTSLMVARAIENVSYVVAVNRVGVDSANIKYFGYSSIINYKGEILATTEANKEEIAYYTIDKNLLNSFRKSFPVGRDWDKFTLL